MWYECQYDDMTYSTLPANAVVDALHAFAANPPTAPLDIQMEKTHTKPYASTVNCVMGRFCKYKQESVFKLQEDFGK